jgi:two-component sensor histidine kinase
MAPFNPTRHVSGLPRYAFGFGAFLATILLRFGLSTWMPSDRGFILFVPSIALATLLGGLGPGIMTAALSGAAIWYAFVPPYYSLRIEMQSAVGISADLVVVVIILALVHRLRSTIAKLQREYERSEALAAREKLLARELRHRTKNLFAVIDGLASRTLSGSVTLSEARDAFRSRLSTLGRADKRLLESGQGETSLSEIVEAELEPFQGQYSVHGDIVTLPGKTAQNFALVAHELTTNAIKYGALSTKAGRLDVHWTVENSPRRALKFIWKERGGPPVLAPTRKGFGTTLIRSALGRGRLEYDPEGFFYEVEVDLNARSGKSSARAN